MLIGDSVDCDADQPGFALACSCSELQRIGGQMLDAWERRAIDQVLQLRTEILKNGPHTISLIKSVTWMYPLIVSPGFATKMSPS